MKKKVLVVHCHPDMCEIIDVRLRDGLKLNGSTEIQRECDGAKAAEFLRDNISELMLVVVGERLYGNTVENIVRLAKALGAVEGRKIPCVIVAEAQPSEGERWKKRYEYLLTVGDTVVPGANLSKGLTPAVREAIAVCN